MQLEIRFDENRKKKFRLIVNSHDFSFSSHDFPSFIPPLHEKRSEPGAGAAAKGMKDEESLQAGALIGQSSNAIQDHVHDFLSDGVMTSAEGKR